MRLIGTVTTGIKLKKKTFKYELKIYMITVINESVLSPMSLFDSG